TPVSALIHAATMVTAGVYMIARSHVIYDRAPVALAVVAIIGCATALFAATMFHLMTHAFFKALLFLAAGSVIHALGGEQDMRRMGGLRRYLPWTFWTMTIATFAIAGFPPLSGFFSKDEILWRAYSSPYGGWAYWIVALFTAGLTSFYMFRLWFLTFFGKLRGASPRADEVPGRELHHHEGHIHESPRVMLVPLVMLAFLSVVGGWIGVPETLGGSNHIAYFVTRVFAIEAAPAVGAAAALAEHTRTEELALTLA